MKNNLRFFSVTTVLLLLSLSAATYAHHGFVAVFDMTRSITVKGTVTGFEWTNPHAYVNFDARDAKGTVENWSAEINGVAMLARGGWRRDTVKPGDEITVIGNRAKDRKPAILVEKIVLATGQELSSRGLTLPVEGAPAPKE